MILAFAAAVAAGCVPGEPSEDRVPLPRSMAALGDSITRATNVCCRRDDLPRHSWSAGWADGDEVESHYERILPHEPAIRGRHHNLATSGATVAHLAPQAERAVDAGVGYATILMGANDVCTSSVQTMTPVGEFREAFEAAMDILTTGLPDAPIFVASIPNVHRLWQLYRDDPLARTVWDLAGICPSMLSSTATDRDRRTALDRVRAFNRVLEEVCGRYPTCRFDGHAVFGFDFERRHVSTLDVFHPSLEGQAELASLTWERSWWAGRDATTAEP